MNPTLLEKLNSYKAPQEAIDLLRKTKLVFIVGASGAGKDTVLKELLRSDDYHYIVSHTTRSPRGNLGVMEQDGVEYHFVSFDQIGQMLDNGEFIEAKQYSGNIYGTSLEEIKKANQEGKIAISDIEVQGVAEYRAISDKVIPIFLLPPNFETWQKRLMSRYKNSADSDDMQKRMETAKVELQEALSKDYFEYVVNDDLAETVKIADEVAHGHFSNRKNEEAKKIAQNLLEELNKA